MASQNDLNQTPPGARRGKLPTEMPAWRRTLSELTEFRTFGATTILRRLALLEPKKRKKRVRWVFVFAVLGVAAALLLDVSVREWLLERSRPLYARAKAALVKAPPPAASPAPPPEQAPSAAAPASTETAVSFAAATAPAASAAAAPEASTTASAGTSAAPAPSTAPKKKRSKSRSKR